MNRNEIFLWNETKENYGKMDSGLTRLSRILSNNTFSTFSAFSLVFLLTQNSSLFAFCIKTHPKCCTFFHKNTENPFGLASRVHTHIPHRMLNIHRK